MAPVPPSRSAGGVSTSGGGGLRLYPHRPVPDRRGTPRLVDTGHTRAHFSRRAGRVKTGPRTGPRKGRGAKEGTRRRKRKKTRRTSRRGVGRAKRAANDDAEVGRAHARAVSAAVDVIESSSEEEGEVRDDVTGPVAPRRRSEGNEGNEGGAGDRPCAGGVVRAGESLLGESNGSGSRPAGESSGLGESDDELDCVPGPVARPSLQEAAHRVFSDDVGIGSGETSGPSAGEAGVTRASRGQNKRLARWLGEPRDGSAPTRDGTTRDEGESRRAQAARYRR